MAEVVDETLEIAAGPEQVMQVVADVERYPEWQSAITEVAVLNRHPDGRPDRVRLALDLKVTAATVVLAYTHAESAMRWSLVSGDGVNAIDGAYVLAARADGATAVTYRNAIGLDFSLPWFAGRLARSKLLEQALHNLKSRVENPAR